MYNSSSSDHFIHQILCIEPIFELSLSLPCLLINIYFAIRFSQLECFSPNLRILLVISNIITSMSTLLHPIPQLIPPEFYSVQNGQYFGAFVVYGIHWMSMILLMIVDSKFLLVGIERWIAFKYRAVYEGHDGSGSRSILFYYILVIGLLVSLKSGLMFYFSDHESIDERLAWSFVAERCIYLFVSTTCTAGATWIICVVQFTYLSHFIKKYRYTSQSLSESFQIKQISNVVEVIIPLLVAYLMAVVFSGSCMMTIVYLYFFAEHSTQSPYYLVFANAAYYSIPLYTLFSTIYMIWYFKGMRKAVFQDLKWLFGIELDHHVEVHPERIDPEEEARIYFEQLKQSWDQKPQKADV